MSTRTDAMFWAYIVTMAINEGLDLYEFFSELRVSGNVSDETWAAIEADLRATNEAWENR